MRRTPVLLPLRDPISLRIGAVAVSPLQHTAVLQCPNPGLLLATPCRANKAIGSSPNNLPGVPGVVTSQISIACDRCEDGVVTAEGTPKPIEGGRPGPGLLAQIVTAKSREAMPLYRAKRELH